MSLALPTLLPEQGAWSRLRLRRLHGGQFTAVILLCGWLHGVVVRLALAWHGGAGLGETGGVSPIELLTAGIAFAALLRTRSTPPAFVPALLCAVALLLPGSLAANLALLGFAAWTAGSRRDLRVPALLFAGLALCSLWWALVERLAGVAPLAFDAMMVQAVLGPFVAGLERTGNLIGMPGGHQIVILPACSTINALPLILLALAALAMRVGRRPATLGRAACAVALIYTAVNVARLSLAALSPGVYGVVHGAAGLMVFDALATLLPLAAASLLARRPFAAPKPLVTPGLPPARSAVLLAILLLGAGLAAVRAATPPPPPREQRAQAALNRVLAEEGWSWAGRRLVATQAVDLFTRPGCAAPLAVAPAPYAGEAASMLRSALGPQTRWLAYGVLSETAPVRRHAWQELRSAAIARLGGPADSVMPLMAVALLARPDHPAPAGCQPPDAAWARLAALPPA